MNNEFNLELQELILRVTGPVNCMPGIAKVEGF